MITNDGVSYLEHGDVVDMEVHRGGGYLRNSSIHEGGEWTRKRGVVIVKQPGFNEDGAVRWESGRAGVDGTKFHASVAWVKFFDGDTQATDTDPESRGVPNGPKTFVRAATPDELSWAENYHEADAFRLKPLRADPARKKEFAHRLGDLPAATLLGHLMSTRRAVEEGIGATPAERLEHKTALGLLRAETARRGMEAQKAPDPARSVSPRDRGGASLGG